jgi:hypothetical protein
MKTPAIKVPRVRFTLRRIMVAVAIVAVALAGYEVKRRRDVYRQAAKKYRLMGQSASDEERLFRVVARSFAEAARNEARLEVLLGAIDPGGIDPGIYPARVRDRAAAQADVMAARSRAKALEDAREANSQLNTAEAAARRAEYYTRLGQKYERAARHPWLPVEPDPPEPK